MPSRSSGLGVSLLVLLVAACGGGGTAPTQVPSASGPPVAATPVGTTGVPTTAPTTAPTEATGPGEVTPGPVGFRVVHLYAHPDGTTRTLDIFARTDGVVVAFPIQAGVTQGSVIDYIYPPSGGGVIAIETGDAGLPTCITNCTHFVVDATSNAGEGDRRTVLVYPESKNFIVSQTPSDLAGTIEFWEDPKPASVGQMGNALMPADPSRGLLFVVAAPVDEARFGLNLAFAGTAGCQKNLNLPGTMIGGNQVPAFAITGDVGVTLHGNSDQDCSKAPVGGPFAVTGTGGSRAYLFLHGTLADLKALTVPID